MRLATKVRRLRRGWERLGLYGRQSRADHRAVKVGHGGQPSYSRRTQRMLTRLFR
ncbi:MAG TPA: hypothetical protein VFM55_13190 [Micromonosporaceae bacterium]|nr:hypothetical protein [Micromonosporaceae bacterium]